MRISRDGCKTDMGQEGDAMPLGIQQNNDFTQFTMDVWNDKIFYQEQEFLQNGRCSCSCCFFWEVLSDEVMIR